MSQKTYIVEIKYSIKADTIENGKNAVIKIIEMLGIKTFTVKHISEHRTGQQNRALWKYLEQVEAHCSERGLTIANLFKEPTEVTITKHLLHQWIVELIKYALGKTGTSKLNRNEFSAIINKTQDEFGTRLDYHAPFPSIESQILNDEI